MGIGIAFGAPLSSGQTAYAAAEENAFAGFAGVAETIVHERGLGSFHRSYEREGRLYLDIYPAEEPVEVFLDKEHIVVWARTSSSGPGYHMFLIELLEEIGRRCGLTWIVDDEEREYLDEGGYLPARQAAPVEAAFVNWLRSVASELMLPEHEGKFFMLSMRLDLSVEERDFACSPLGYWPRTYFDTLLQKSSSELNEHASQFFPWWSPQMDARFWKSVGMTLLWSDARWHPPTNATERAAIELPLACFDKARQLDSTIDIPELEVAFLRKLLRSSPDDPPVPSPAGIGYWRGLMPFNLTGHWSILAPGYFYESTEDDDRTVVVWHRDMTIRGSSITAKKRKPDGTSPETIADPSAKLDGFATPSQTRSRPNQRLVEEIKLSKEDLAGIAGLFEDEAATPSTWHVQATWEHRTAELVEVCVLTIDFDESTDKQKAMEIVNSVRFDPPK